MCGTTTPPDSFRADPLLDSLRQAILARREYLAAVNNPDVVAPEAIEQLFVAQGRQLWVVMQHLWDAIPDPVLADVEDEQLRADEPVQDAAQPG